MKLNWFERKMIEKELSDMQQSYESQRDYVHRRYGESCNFFNWLFYFHISIIAIITLSYKLWKMGKK